MALGFDDGITFQAQLYPGIRVNGIINTAVTGIIAPRHTAVGSVYNGIASQSGDVSLPYINTRF